MTNPQCSADHPCTAVQLLTQRQIDTSEEVAEIKEDLKAIRDRLPPWVLVAGCFGSALIGVLGTLASK